MNKNKFYVAYGSTSYVFVNKQIKLVFRCKNNNITWKSLNEEVAIVNDGVVTGVKAGYTDINVYLDNELVFSYKVTVLEQSDEEIINDLLAAHNSNIFIRKDMWIDGKNGYLGFINESVSKILFDEPFVINDEYLELGNKKWKNSPTNEFLQSIEFITVHYTGNPNKGTNARMHCKYFVSEDQPTSIHYNTGNDGVFLCIDNDKRAAHAGDSLGPVFEWVDTGVDYDGRPLDNVVVSSSDDFYFVINGKKSKIKLPEPYEYKERKTKHTYLSNGVVQLEGSNELRRAEEFFNKMGFAFIVKENRYFMSKTWWCYTQKYEGAICNVGGNRNSIGIESAIDEGSDLWYTWQLTAKLVAKLMLDNNLDITRVKGHHFYTAKNCPQPMLENNMEIWHKFIKLVKAEYLFMTKYKNYEIKMIPFDDCIKENGRIECNDNTLKCISYKLEIVNKENNNKEEIILSSLLNN